MKHRALDNLIHAGRVISAGNSLELEPGPVADALIAGGLVEPDVYPVPEPEPVPVAVPVPPRPIVVPEPKRGIEVIRRKP